jgi:hypothetical protein
VQQGAANVVERTAGSTPVVVAPTLTQTFASKRFTPHVSLRAPAGWNLGTDNVSQFSVNAPRGSTSIEFLLDPYASSPIGAPLSNVSRTANGLSAWLHDTSALHAAAGQGSRLGRPVLSVQSIDIGASSHPSAYLTFRDHGRATTFATGPGPTRLYLASIRIDAVHTLAVAVRPRRRRNSTPRCRRGCRQEPEVRRFPQRSPR